MTRLLCRFINDQTGATAIEYSLIAALIALAIFSGVGSLAGTLKLLWNDNSNRLVQGMASN